MKSMKFFLPAVRRADAARLALGWRFGDYIRTYTGARFYVLDPRPEDVHVVDLAHHLSLLCRFNGGIRTMYSVAEHSVRISEYLDDQGVEVALWGLLHDASEAYLGDMVRPLKHSWLLWGYRFVERRVMAAVIARFQLAPIEPASVKVADTRICVSEAAALRVFARGDVQGARSGVAPLPGTIKPWPSVVAERRFLMRYERLMRLRELSARLSASGIAWEAAA